MTSCRSSCARRARARGSSTCPAITTSSCAIFPAIISAASRSSSRRSMSPRTEGATSSCMATPSTWWCAMPNGSRISATGPTSPSLGFNTVLNVVRRRLGLHLLVAVGLGQAQGQERGQLHRPLRGDPCRGGAAARLRRRDLRPYPPRGAARSRRHRLCQHRRLGRELHRDRRARRTAASRSSAGPIGPCRCRRCAMQTPGSHRRRRAVKILVATDAWQAAGQRRRAVARADGGRRRYGSASPSTSCRPTASRLVPMPSYPEIRLALPGRGQIERRIAAKRAGLHPHRHGGPDRHPGTRACLKRGRPFTTSYHTRFPEYIAARAPIPEALSYGWLRNFHNAGSGTMVSTAAMEQDLDARGFRRLMRWSRGVDRSAVPAARRLRPRSAAADLSLCRPRRGGKEHRGLPRTRPAGLQGRGRRRARRWRALKPRHPRCHFTGTISGRGARRAYASADVFVFPSLTDTFGIVLLEAMASGLPVAAFPVHRPARRRRRHGGRRARPGSARRPRWPASLSRRRLPG